MGTMLRSVNSAINYRIELDNFGRIVAITVVTCGKDTLTRIWPLKYVCEAIRNWLIATKMGLRQIGHSP